MPDYTELMDKIAAINAAASEETYLYQKEEYDPEAENAEREEIEGYQSEGFELPDFLKDIKDGIIKIQ